MVIRTDRPSMTIAVDLGRNATKAVDLGRKATKQTKISIKLQWSNCLVQATIDNVKMYDYMHVKSQKLSLCCVLLIELLLIH